MKALWTITHGSVRRAAARVRSIAKGTPRRSTIAFAKRKFGGAVRSKRYESQVNEVLAKVSCFNLSVLVHEMHELGIMPEFLPVTV